MSTTRKERVEKIQALEQARGDRTLVVYVTSTRPNVQVMMGMDVIPIIYEHLRELGVKGRNTKIDLMIHTNGGEGVVPWRLVTLLREFASELCLLVPHRAFSAGTLTALGADEVIMHPMGMLGPIDPTVIGPFNPPNPNNPAQPHGISVEDVAAYINLVKDDVGITHEDELVQAFNVLADKVHPLALGNVKRSSMQSRMMAEKLLLARSKKVDRHTVSEITEKLGSRLYYHGHPINRTEARQDLDLDFVKDASPEVEEAMWNLYACYAQDMLMDKEFQPLQETVAAITSPLPQPGQPPAVDSVTLDPLRTVHIESRARSDCRDLTVLATVVREWSGKFANLEVAHIKDAWTTEH